MQPFIYLYNLKNSPPPPAMDNEWCPPPLYYTETGRGVVNLALPDALNEPTKYHNIQRCQIPVVMIR